MRPWRLPPTPCLRLLAPFLAAGGLLSTALGQFSEAEVKVGLLYNFAVYTQWPSEAFPSPDADLVLGILGEHSFGGALDFLRGKSIRNRKLVVRQLHGAEQAANCQLLFIPAAARAQTPQVLKTLDKAAVLTVSDGDDFLREGGMVRLFLFRSAPDKESVRFEVNKAAADRANLKLHSGFLKAATRVLQ